MCEDLFEINSLIKQFLCCTPINVLDSKVSKQISYITLEEQKRILEKTVNSNLIKKYPIKLSYQISFLKWFINKIEKSSGEVQDDVYTIYCKLMCSKLDESIHYRHFVLGNEESNYISIQESTNMISRGTTGLCIWQGAVELGQWCIANKNEFHNKVILELGCGVGLTGLYIIKQCSPKQYIFTDSHRAVLQMASNNVKYNLSQMKEMLNDESKSKDDRLVFKTQYNNTDVDVMELRWEDINEYINEHSVVPDIIIGADILYDSDSFHALVTGLKAFLCFDNKYAIIAGMIRNEDTISRFLHELEFHNLIFEECTVPEQLLHIQITNSPVKILKIFKKDNKFSIQ
ncbi:protein-lysine N-methyltransferase EEF2KMT [Calliopsis andreniformis]|uniref:protein-lysine N-methyltransferase EEF2KMT n=1 Tax=Calliopsis andreniformis TaxID=337506 RepID=UPI003FCCF070